MCIRVEHAPLSSLVPWDPDRAVITIPAELNDPHAALQAIHHVLTELAVPQTTVSATCWCGDPITFPNNLNNNGS